MLHGELYDAVQKSGLERLYQLSVRVFAWSGPSLEALEILAGGARDAGNEFPLPAFALRHITIIRTCKVAQYRPVAEGTSYLVPRG